jgi:hypothetical protein
MQQRPLPLRMKILSSFPSQSYSAFSQLPATAVASSLLAPLRLGASASASPRVDDKLPSSLLASHRITLLTRLPLSPAASPSTPCASKAPVMTSRARRDLATTGGGGRGGEEVAGQREAGDGEAGGDCRCGEGEALGDGLRREDGRTPTGEELVFTRHSIRRPVPTQRLREEERRRGARRPRRWTLAGARSPRIMRPLSAAMRRGCSGIPPRSGSRARSSGRPPLLELRRQ